MLTMKKLKMIQNDLSCGPQFITLCKEFEAEESAVFLMEVARYKRNPTLGDADRIYETYIKPSMNLGFSAQSYTINIGGLMREETALKLTKLRERMAGLASANSSGYKRPMPASPSARRLGPPPQHCLLDTGGSSFTTAGQAVA